MSKKISNRIIFVYTLTVIVFGIAFFLILPTILNYPPDSINNEFQRNVDIGLLYNEQYFLIIFVCFIIGVLSIKIYTRKIDNVNLDVLRKYNLKNSKLVNKLFNLPYSIFFIHTLIPTFIIICLYALLEGSVNMGTLKISLVILTLDTLIALAVYVYCKNMISKLLRTLYLDKKYINNFSSLKNRMFIIILPMILVALVFSSLLGYSQIVQEKGQYMFVSNKMLLENCITKDNYSLDEISETLKSLTLLEEENDKFIVFSENDYISLNGQNLSNFFIKYTIEQSDNHNGRTYDTYGIDKQGVVKKVTINNQVAYVGIAFDITTGNVLFNLALGIIILFILNCFVLYYISKSLADETSQVALALNGIVHNSSSKHYGILPITSNDEIAQLIIAFNEIQSLTQEHIKEIEDNQSMLMEKERLASLGQMIGGIAHNLKTPIMSISGAAEGLKELTHEYDISIGDPEVTNQDHHDIVKDMDEWIKKIKKYTEYMSDVITAVKGQAVTFSDEASSSFTIKEVVKYVDVLMKHELKNSLIDLNVSVNIPETVSIKGNINSLVQVINNMISNAIQSYNGKPNNHIDLTINLRNNNIDFIIQDYGSGIPKKVQDKLFKEMITTKGKNGTGLGLFMSYSNIRAHFNGSMRFESEEGKGTKFIITIPIS